MTLTEALALPNSTKVLCCHIKINRRFGGAWVVGALVNTLTTDFWEVLDEKYRANVYTVTINGTAYSRQTTASACNTNDESYYYDEDTGTLYINPGAADEASGYHCTRCIVGVELFVSSVEKFAFDHPTYGAAFPISWLPRLDRVPGVRVAIETYFGGVGKTGSGVVALHNQDDFFSDFRGWNWDGGTVDLYMGVDVSWDTMAWSDYEQIGRWKVDSWSMGESVVLKLREYRESSDISLPLNTFNRDDYPNLKEDSVGQPIPIAYGQIYRAKAHCTDTTAKTFKVADHAIHSFITIYDSGSQVDADSVDVATGSFTYTAWDGETEIRADFIGKADATGNPMTNSSDVIKDLLVTYVGLDDSSGTEDLDLTSFSDARTRWVRGTKAGVEVHGPEIMRLVAASIDVKDLVKELCDASFCSAYTGQLGDWKLVVWDPKPSIGAMVLEQADILKADIKYEVKSAVSGVKIEYRIREDGPSQFVEATDDRLKEERQFPAHKLKTSQLAVHNKIDAEVFASRMLYMMGTGVVVLQLTTGPKPMLEDLGSTVRVTWPPLGLDSVYDLVGISYDPTSHLVQLTLTNMRGFGDNVCFLVDSTAVDADIGGGNLDDAWDDAWSDTKKKWRRENAGYLLNSRWMVDDGASDPADYADTFRISRVI